MGYAPTLNKLNKTTKDTKNNQQTLIYNIYRPTQPRQERHTLLSQTLTSHPQLKDSECLHIGPVGVMSGEYGNNQIRDLSRFILVGGKVSNLANPRWRIKYGPNSILLGAHSQWLPWSMADRESPHGEVALFLQIQFPASLSCRGNGGDVSSSSSAPSSPD